MRIFTGPLSVCFSHCFLPHFYPNHLLILSSSISSTFCKVLPAPLLFLSSSCPSCTSGSHHGCCCSCFPIDLSHWSTSSSFFLPELSLTENPYASLNFLSFLSAAVFTFSSKILQLTLTPWFGVLPIIFSTYFSLLFF